MWRAFILLLMMLLVCRGATTEAGHDLQLAEDDVVVFVGGTNMVHLQQAGYLEASLTKAFAAARPNFRDLAWEADTVFRLGTVIERWRKDGWRRPGFGDLAAQLDGIGATVVIAQFGQLESMAGLNGLDDFTAACETLVNTFQAQAREVVLITPLPFESVPGELIPNLVQHNADLAVYVEATRNIAAARGLVFVDLFTNPAGRVTDNGMHVRDDAQAAVATRIAQLLSVPDANPMEPLRQAVMEKHRLWYDYWRPANWKLLYGDDAERQFTRGGEDSVSFKEEWMQLVPLIATAEERVWFIAAGGVDPGPRRRDPEVLHADPHADIEQELADFSPADGLQVNLFASEEHGLTSPLNLRWDAKGRMYVTVTTTYPHVFPGDVPNDRIILLEDTDNDGTADQSTVFADGLNIPTGIELGNGGVYVGQNTEILFLKDTDGDGGADHREVLFSGFGNGDSHQTINSFIWSPDGEMYFGHGDGCESRVETPWGASNLFNAGYYRLRPKRLQLVPFLEGHMSAGNPWGVAFGEWGQMFAVDGAGGVSWLAPGLVSTTHREPLRRIGDPGGYCGIGFLDGPQLPKSMHGDFAVGDFKPNRVSRFSVKNSGADFKLEWKKPLLRSKHRNFRPVDVKVGPDGAVYVVDWYNPITCHQDDAYRDPTRDKAHGRIWRLSGTAKTAPSARMDDAPLADVLTALKSSEHWKRYQAKRVLTERDPSRVAAALRNWVRSLDARDPNYEHHLYEALGAFATIEVVEPGLLGRLLHASNPLARAYATRLTGRWHDRLERPLQLLTERVADEHALVRMEAVVACSAIRSPHSITVAARVVDKPMEEWIRYSLKQTVRHLRPVWMPAFREGKLSFAQPAHLAAVLNEVGGRAVLDSLKSIAESPDLEIDVRMSAISAILAVGDPDDLAHFGFEQRYYTHKGRYSPTRHSVALSQLISSARTSDVRPSGNPGAQLTGVLNHEHPDIKASALRLAGAWQVTALAEQILDAARDNEQPLSVRAAAIQSLADMDVQEAADVLRGLAGHQNSPELRSAAIQSLAAIETDRAAELAAELFLSSGEDDFDPAPVIAAFLNRIDGPHVLAAALSAGSINPATARRLLRGLFATGRSDQILFDVLNRALGAAHQVPDYSQKYVTELVNEAREHGDVARGAAFFGSMACASCHKISGTGGSTGPDLTSIGTTLSAERIVEELLWPSRQVKEGYTVVVIVTNQGLAHTGIERTTPADRDAGIVVLEDLATKERFAIRQVDIEEKRKAGSPMPAGLTAVLPRPQLLDLIQYLSQLGAFR